ncbi:MAG: TRAP transporter small permease subunit [Ectothiorhodospiraceae bacterium]|nr:TRAP transporter small permease subunit [Ectothiorhodospiraceae bacterium]
MTRLVRLIERFNRAVGRTVSLLILVMIGVIMYETVARYFFNAPTPWAHDVSGWLQVVYVFLGGAWALQRGYLVRVDIVFGRLSSRAQAVVDLTLSTVLFACFAAVVLWKGTNLALLSLKMGETSATGVWKGPVYPAKAMVPLGMLLLTAAWLAHCARQAMVLLGRPIEDDDPAAPGATH